MKSGIVIIVFLLFLLLLFSSCNSVDPPPPPGEKPTLTLTLEDVSCIEAWIKLTTSNLQLPASITLQQNDLTRTIINLTRADSMLYIDSLLPNANYSFKTSIQSSSHTSNELNVTTMDTTSHDFTFETFTFGGTAGSSTLYDVAIISPDNIWAVGEILVADTSQNGYTIYNALHWDGNQWELKRIPFLFQGDSFYNPIYAVFAFNADDIWFGIGNLIHWDGVKYWSIGISSVFPSLVNKIWGNSSSNLYVVGNNGCIAWYNGTRWSLIESGTHLNINDIWGDYNEKIGEWEILAVASNKFLNEGKIILQIDGLLATEISVVGLPWSLSSIWFKTYKKYYVGGDGLYYKKSLSENWLKDETFIPIYKDRIRGVNINDIMVSGSNGLFSHYNGISWKQYINNELPYYSGRLLSCDIKENVIIAVGWKELQAIITVGNR